MDGLIIAAAALAFVAVVAWCTYKVAQIRTSRSIANDLDHMATSVDKTATTPPDVSYRDGLQDAAHHARHGNRRKL
jgi:hypothetical protein